MARAPCHLDRLFGFLPFQDYTREDARVLKAHISTDAAHELGICMRANVLLHIAGFPDALYLVDMAKAVRAATWRLGSNRCIYGPY